MHLNPAYLLFALLSPVAYAAPTTAEISNIPIRGKPLVNERKHKLVPEPVDLNTNTKKIKLEEEGEKMDVNEQTHDLTPKHDNTVHVKISGRPHRTYQTFSEKNREYLQPRLESMFQHWIRNMKLFKLEKEGKKISADMLDPLESLKPLNIVIEKESVPELKHFEFDFWGSGVKEIPGFQGCEFEKDSCAGKAFDSVVFFSRYNPYASMYYAYRNGSGYGDPLEQRRVIE